MSASQLILYLNWAVFLLIFGRVLFEAVRKPWRIAINIALLFSIPAANALIGIAGIIGLLPGPSQLRNIITALLLLIPFLLLRLVDDFVSVRLWLRRLIGAAVLVLTVAVASTPTPQPAWLTGLAFVAMLALLSYGAVAFLRASRLASGVTRRRMQVVALGSLLFMSAFLISIPLLFNPGLRNMVLLLANSCVLCAGICYFIGFTPPRSLRRAWQEPELRAFLGRAARMPQLPDTAAIVAEFEQGAANALGAPVAALGLWSEQKRALHFRVAGQPVLVEPTASSVLTQVWHSQKAFFADHNLTADSSVRTLAPKMPIVAGLVAPITAGDLRLGVLAIFSARVPLFAADDLELVQLLADQVAVIIESRALIDEAARVRVHAESTRLKEDFLAAAAHDLKTPLTSMLARAELLARRTARNPHAPADLASVQMVLREGQRLKRLMLDLLDSARIEQGQLVGRRSAVDLAALVREVVARQESGRHHYKTATTGPVVGLYDAVRIEQLLENLVENAVKYSPDGGTIAIELEQADGRVSLRIADEGIGIPETDLPAIFERFQRAANATDRAISGLGLGLFICRGIVEQHGGTINVTSRPGAGTTFLIDLPHNPVPAEQPVSV